MIHGRLFRVHARPAAGDAIVAARQPVDRAVGCGEGLGASHVPASIAKPVAGARRGTDIGSQTGHRVQFVALVEHATIAVSNFLVHFKNLSYLSAKYISNTSLIHL